MQALIGIAAQGTDAAPALAEAARALAQESRVISMSRPWWAPARLGEDAGLLAVAHIETPRRQRLRPWLWRLQDAAPSRIQLEVVAGLDRKIWRFGVALEGEDAAFLGPVSDVMPTLRLRSGVTVMERFLLHPHPDVFPWMAAGQGRSMERPAGYDAIPLGRTWEAKPMADRPVTRRTPLFLP